MAIYAAMVDSLDQNIGRFVKVLKGQNQWDNTLFIFVSDNGASPFERSSGTTILPWLPKTSMHCTGVEWGGCMQYLLNGTSKHASRWRFYARNSSLAKWH